MGTQSTKRYENLDGVRAICCLAIIAMHVRANSSYEITGGGYIYNTIIPSWTQFVFLFLMISGFSMCCGYYEKFSLKQIDLTEFYIRRYKKILPFFVVLVIIDIILERSMESVYEGFIEITLLHGLLPNNKLSVIGVSWTLGVIFLFYMLFPFFVFLLHSKKFAWGSFIVSIVIVYMCEAYFFTDKFVVDDFVYRHTFIYCLPFFMLGGIIYLYRQEIEIFISKHKYAMFILCLFLTVIYYVTPSEIADINLENVKLLLVFGAWLSFLISCRTVLLDNKVMHFLGGISLELYLAQMLSFRVVERLGLLYVLGDGWLGYIFAYIIVVILLIAFVVVIKGAIDFIVKMAEDHIFKPANKKSIEI